MWSVGKLWRRWKNIIKLILKKQEVRLWIGFIWLMDQWQTFLHAVMDLRIPFKEVNFLTSWATISFSRRNLICWVSQTRRPMNSPLLVLWRPTERLSVSQEGLWSIELFIYVAPRIAQCSLSVHEQHRVNTTSSSCRQPDLCPFHLYENLKVIYKIKTCIQVLNYCIYTVYLN